MATTAMPVMNRNGSDYRRKILSRSDEQMIKINKALPAGEDTTGCITCCHAPACCAMCSVCPCCSHPEYITKKLQASKYVLIRENSIEWNSPKIVMKDGRCFGIDPCVYDIEDRVTVLYFDNPVFRRMTDQTRICNECRTCICGGRGEQVQIDSPCCFNLCLRTSFPCPCYPVCCPSGMLPCIRRHLIFVEDAQQAMHDISLAVKSSQLPAPGDSESTI